MQKCVLDHFPLPPRDADAAISPAVKSTSVPGSGTAATPAAAIAEPVIGAPACDGSKMKVPPAPTVKLVPSGKAVDEVATSVPPLTLVPPL